MYKPKSIYTKVAFETIVSYLKEKEIKANETDEKLQEKNSCFVTIHKKNGELRGCIGTILPYRDTLYEEIISNAIAAATQDPRFSPMEISEIDSIYLSVDVLSKPKKVDSIAELNPKKYGVIISKGIQKGVLLPNLEGVDSVSEQLNIAKIKGGIQESDFSKLKVEKFESKRYY